MYLRNIDLNSNHQVPKFKIGALGTDNDETDIFEYVRFDNGTGNVTAVAGHLVVGCDAGSPNALVTNDPSSATPAALEQDPRGFLQTVLTDQYYGWAQTWGRNRQIVVVSGAISKGATAMAHPTTDAAVVAHDASAVPSVGVALEAAAGSEFQIGEFLIKIKR